MRMLYFCIAATLLLGGCSKESTQQTALSEPELTRQYRHNSVTVIISISETNILTSGKIQLALDIHTPPGSEITFPELGEFIAPFSVGGSYTEPVQMLANGKQLHRRVWELAPSLPGITVFQPIQLHVGEMIISVDPIEIQVASLLPEGLDSFEIMDIAEPVTLLPEQKKKQRFGYILLGTTITLASIILLIKRARRPAVLIELTAHEAALQALADLSEEELPRIHELSGIVVAFIGRRFHLPTTGKTIGEIIPLLPKKEFLDHQALLEQFLVTGEQIRFSNKIPAGFADELEEYVRSFVENMKEEPCD